MVGRISAHPGRPHLVSRENGTAIRAEVEGGEVPDELLERRFLAPRRKPVAAEPARRAADRDDLRCSRRPAKPGHRDEAVTQGGDTRRIEAVVDSDVSRSGESRASGTAVA